MTYTITATNDGETSADANDILITDVVPAGMEFVSATDGEGTDNSSADCEENDGTITCTLDNDGKLQKERTVIVTVVLRVTTENCTELTNTATVTSSNNSPAESNGSTVNANGTCSSSSSSGTSSSGGSSSGGSSSGGGDGEGSSSSSGSGGGSEDVSAFTEGAPGGDDGGTGARRGNGTGDLNAKINRIAGLFGLGEGTPPPAFGGTEEANELICSVQRSIRPNALETVFEFAAEILAALTGMDKETILENLHSDTYCNGISAFLRPSKNTVVNIPRPIQLDAEGYPVSSNKFWNLCIRGKWTKADLALNTDIQVIRRGKIVKYVPKSCDAYHQGVASSNVWTYPDDTNLKITIVPVKGGAPRVSAPTGFVVVPAAQATASK